MTTLRSHAPLLVFGGVIVSVYGAALFIVAPALATVPRPDVLAAALTVDLTVLVPVCYYVSLVRRRGWPAFSTVPVFLVSLGAAAWLVPSEHQSLLHLIEWLIAPAELVLLGYVGVKVYRARRQFRASDKADVYERLREGFFEVVGVRRVADAMAFEMTMLYYAFLSWQTPPADGSKRRAFSYHQSSGYGPLVTAILVAMLVELIALHLLLSLWSPAAAWVMTALSIYGVVWIVGDWRAAVCRPILIEEDALLIKIGLRWTVRVPFAVIGGVYPIRKTPPDGKAPGYLEAVLLGKPTYRVVCKEPVVAQGLYGVQKQVTTIGFALDDTAAFEVALKKCFAAWQQQQA